MIFNSVLAGGSGGGGNAKTYKVTCTDSYGIGYTVCAAGQKYDVTSDAPVTLTLTGEQIIVSILDGTSSAAFSSDLPMLCGMEVWDGSNYGHFANVYYMSGDTTEFYIDAN